MPRGRKVGGRQKGTPNKASVSLREMMERETGGIPIPVLLVRMHLEASRNGDLPTAIASAKAACPYGYQQLKAIEHTGQVAVTMPEPIEQGGPPALTVAKLDAPPA